MKTAAEPFRFYARFALTLATGRRAVDLRSLRDGIAELPDSVIYRHTLWFVVEHESLVPEPPNDFSLWVSEALHDRATAERLAAVDSLGFSSIRELREELLRVLDGSLARGAARTAPPEGEFYFLDAVRFSVPTGLEARTLPEFAEALKKTGPSSLYLHLYEAKFRPPLGVNDFSRWFETALGDRELAEEVAALDLYRHTLENVRRKVLEKVEEHLEEAPRASA